MFNYLFMGIFSIGVLTSCTTKNIDLLSKESLYKQGLENTRIKTILYNDKVQGVLNITYLNPTNPKLYDEKYNEFLIGIYLDEQKGIFTLSLNNKNYVSRELLKENSKLYKNIPSYNPYSKYYIFKFEKDKSEKAILNFKYKKSNTSIEFKTF